MSELINNREYRQKVLKELIMELHDGKSVDDVKERFAKLIEGVSVAEISEMEQRLIMEGMPIEEVQRLCDVHAAVFEGSIEDIHKPTTLDKIPGHPMHTFKLENQEIERRVEENAKPALETFKESDSPENVKGLLDNIEDLMEIDKHYSRKENIVFPFLENAGITAPPKVMWGVDDEIRDELKEVRSLLEDYKGNKNEVAQKAEEAIRKISEMVFKEENILFPLIMDTLSEDEWLTVYKDSDEIGYTFITPSAKWEPERVDFKEKETKSDLDSGVVRFDSGFMTPKEIEALFNHLPIDITFVDKDDRVKYFSQSSERIFARPKSVIGRTVENCHPPSSVHVVNKIVEDFKSGAKDSEEFWIRMGEQYVLIRYYAVRDENGEYMGTVEVSQDIAPLQKIEGEKRLLSDEG
ncbi:MAG: DUF438 domain-containing protein [Clostridiales bacterium]|nr:DUF438 domain-containing protein [Clostridiales bacterium]